MVKKLMKIFVIMVVLFSPQTFAASGKNTLHKFVGLELGYGTYSFPEKLDHKLVFPVANLTTGLAYKRLNLVLNLSGSISDADVSEEETFGSASRQDIDLTLGYQLNKLVSVFTGYKNGETNITLINRNPEDPPAGGKEFYKQKGPYIGANINWAFEAAGKFAFTVAYAALDADNLFVGDGGGEEPPEFDDIGDRTQGNTNGYSVTLNWTMPMKGNLIFRTRFRFNQYQQDINYEGIEYKDIDESSTLLLVGVTGIF